MAKEKYLKKDIETKDLTFYYEIVGIVSLIIPVLAFARLGVIGFYIMLVFKITFGDWYFLFLLAIFCYGLRCLIYHKPMNFKTLRIIGIILVLVGVMMLSHFPMHKYVASFDKEQTGGYYRLTLGLYLDYFKNYYDGMVVGGGIIGSSCFYLFYSLFSSIGTIFMIIVFVFVGLVFFTEKTINEFLGIFGKWGIVIYKFLRKKFKSFKYEVVVPKHKKRKRRITINDLPETTGIKYEGYEHTKAKEIKEKIDSGLNRLNVFYNDISVIIGYNVTTFIVDTIQYVDQKKLSDYLKSVLDNAFLIKKEVKTKKIIIEVNNTYESIYDIRTALLSQQEYLKNFEYNVAVTSLNEYIKINLLKDVGIVLEDFDNSSLSFINAFILMTYIKNSQRDFRIRFLQTSLINDLVSDANNILSVLNKEQYPTINEFNSNSLAKEKIKRNIIIIDDLKEIIKTSDELERLAFLLQVGTKIGYFFVFRLGDKTEIPQILNNYLSKVFYFKNAKNLSISKNIKSYEAFYECKDIIERVTMVGIENSEFEKFKDQL